MTDILSGNTNPKVNPFWGKFALTGPDKARRPATLKTGTNNDAKDLNAYGFIAPPTEAGRAKGEYALAVGAWNGNSDNTPVSTPKKPVFSIDVSTYVWQGFLQEATKTWEVNDFAQPDGLTQAKIDPFTGLRPQAGAKAIDEWFIAGTEPKDSIPEGACGQAVLDTPGVYEHNYPNWLTADLDWLNRAKQRAGHGRRGQPDRGPRTSTTARSSRTAGPGERSSEGHGCSAPSPSVTCYPVPTPDASGLIPSFVVPSADPSSNIVYEPCATPSSLPANRPAWSLGRGRLAAIRAHLTPTPTAAPTPTPTPAPTPPPTPRRRRHRRPRPRQRRRPPSPARRPDVATRPAAARRGPRGDAR